MNTLGFLAEPLAIVRPSNSTATPDVVEKSLARLWRKHAAGMAERERMIFAATLDVERAATHYRAGRYVRTALFLLRSFIKNPRLRLRG